MRDPQSSPWLFQWAETADASGSILSGFRPRDSLFYISNKILHI